MINEEEIYNSIKNIDDDELKKIDLISLLDFEGQISNLVSLRFKRNDTSGLTLEEKINSGYYNSGEYIYPTQDEEIEILKEIAKMCELHGEIMKRDIEINNPKFDPFDKKNTQTLKKIDQANTFYTNNYANYIKYYKEIRDKLTIGAPKTNEFYNDVLTQYCETEEDRKTFVTEILNNSAVIETDDIANKFDLIKELLPKM